MAQPIGHLEKVRALATSARLCWVAGVRADKSSQINAYDHVAEKPEHVIEVPSHVLALVAGEDLLVAACSDGIVRVYTQKDGKSIREIKAHEGACNALALRKGVLATGGADGALRLFDLSNGKKTKEWHLSSRPLRAVAIDPAGESFAGAGDDGVVRVIGHGEERRDMTGHDGPVSCLAFTPADGRLVSGGEDGMVRIWYLIGAVESDVRGKDDSGHLGGVLGLMFLPAKDPTELGERLASCGADGKVRLWRMSERRKPRTLEAGSEPVFALAFAPSTRSGTLGSLVAAGDSRTVYGFPCDAAGAVGDKTFRWVHGFDVLAESLAAPARAKREGAIKTLAPLGEPEALELLIKSLASDKEPEVRAQIAGELASHDRRDARKALRARLDDEHTLVRMAALAALRNLEPDAPLSPLRSALDSRFADTRIAALTALPALFTTAPLVSGLIASHLADEDAGVRRSAVMQLVSLHPAGSVEPLRVAFERGKADVRAEVLVRGALAKLTTNADFSPIVGKALDDDDSDVRRLAFVISALSRPVLGAWLEKSDEPFGRALGDLLRRAVQLEGGAVSADGVDPDPARVKDVSQFFARFTHPKHGEVSIFQPKLHTPIKPGDEVRLVRIAPVGNPPNVTMRAEDYVLGAAAESSAEQVAAVRGKLVVAAAAKEPAEVDREPLLSALACRTADTALRGARGLALLGDMRALGALLTISREPDAALRRDGVVALAALPDARARRRIVWMLNDADASVRDAALACYGKLESAPLLVAEAALHSSQEDVRVRGLDILVKQGKGNADAERLLGDAIEDEAAKVRGEAFRTLWAWHDADPLGPIDRALSARFPDLRLRAVTELGTFAKKSGDKLAAPSLERLSKTIGDRDQAVAKAAYTAALEIKGKDDDATHLAAIASTHPALRAEGAKDAAKAPVENVRSALMKLLEDTEAFVRIAAIESLDKLVKGENGPLGVGLQSSHLDLRVRAAELLAERRDELAINPMQALLADKELLQRLPPAVIVPLRQRAATALANLGTPRLLKYFATELVKDDDAIVREQAARGLSNASRRGEEGYLLDLLGHTEVAIRSWAAEGLARLGDARALPVLTGTLRHEHPPIRVGAILSFAALGPEGYGGMLQGLEDASREVQRIVLAVILARDLRAFRKQESPELLTSALSSQRPEVRFAAARALELRISPEEYLAHLVELLMPERPEKAADMERWPDEDTRARFMVGLAEALAGDRPEQRYAAAQALRLRDRPIEYFREVQRAVMPRSVKSPWIPDTTPRAPAEGAGKKKPLALLRRLFASGVEADEQSPEPAASPVPAEEQRRLRLLAFGAYVGLLRQAGSDDEGHRVRRDAIERLVELCQQSHVSVASATPALARALDDPNHLVRQAAFAALRKVYANDPEAPLSLALASSSADVVKAALDELAARGEVSKPRVAKALDSRVAQARKYAFDLLEKLSPPGSLEPLLAALSSEHPDIRIGVLERLSTSQDPRVAAALVKALESDHDDLRLRAAEMLSARKDDRAADALAPWLRAEDANVAQRARDALAGLGSAAAVRALSARFEDTVPDAERVALTEALARTKAGEAAIDALSARFADETEAVRAAAFAGCVVIAGPRSDAPRVRGAAPPKPRNVALAKRFLEAAIHAKSADVRALGAAELDDLDDASADALLVSIFGDRDVTVRATAVRSYARRVEKKASKPEPLLDVLKGGARETMLAAAEGLASRNDSNALRPLLLFARAGDGGDRERALLALGTLGDKRALSELEVIAAGGTEEAPAEVSMQAAALEGLGHLLHKLDPDDRERIRDRVESSVGTKEQALAVAAVRALRWMGGERGRARIEAVLAERSSSNDERVAATKALGELADPASEKPLAKALNDYTDDVRWGAREALEKLFPKDRTRVEFLAVESDNEDISEPAAAFLADEGNAGLLLEKLAKLSNDGLRERIRFGLVRREKVPSSDLAKLLSADAAAARSDAAWLTGARSKSVTDSDRKALGPALLEAARRAEKAHAEAGRLGKNDEQQAELDAWLRSAWAARMVDAAALRSDAKRWLADANAPVAIRVEAAHALKGAASELTKALSDADGNVRSAAGSALAPIADVLTLKRAPLDPVRMSLAAEGAEPSAKALATSEGRRALLARLIRDGDTEVLESLAREGAARLEAIAALGRAATSSAIETLTELASEDGESDEELRKAAFRSLRRAQRIAQRKEAR